MKLLGLSCGKKMGNSEILIKEALMEAEKVGVEAEIIRLLDLDIKPCRHCEICPRRETGDPNTCILKDDMPFIWEKLMVCDGLIVSMPVYILAPPGYFKLLCDRVLLDVSHLIERKKRGTKTFIDERAFKSRVGGFLSVGAAPFSDWVSMGLPLMHCLTFPRQIEIVDQLQVLNAYGPGHVLMDNIVMKRAGKLGRHVAEAMGRPADQVKWMGDAPGTCPMCHSNLMVIGKNLHVECAVCGIKGVFKIVDNTITLIFDSEEQKKSRLTIEGKAIHFHEMLNVMNDFQLNKDIIQKKSAKYRAYKSSSC